MHANGHMEDGFKQSKSSACLFLIFDFCLRAANVLEVQVLLLATSVQHKNLARPAVQINNVTLKLTSMLL